MAELGTRCTTERVQIGNSLPTAARVVFLPDYLQTGVKERGDFLRFRINTRQIGAFVRVASVAGQGKV